MLEKLNEYKEIIGIVVFFLGGFFWIENQFPTKADLTAQISVLKCQVTNYMTLTQLQTRERYLENSIAALDHQIELFDNRSSSQPPLSPAMQQELDQQKSTRSDNAAALKKITDNIQSVYDGLERQICGQ